MIPNILAERYASPEMVALFHPTEKVILERKLWVAVLEAQINLGMDVDTGVVDDYRQVIDEVDHESINHRERLTRHDVKARIEEFNFLAGHQSIHAGLTSRDATENVEQITVWRALELVEQRTLALLARLAEHAATYATTTIVARTHNVAAQPTTMGKRFAQLGEELLGAYRRLVALRADYALRGIKGPVGSQQDLVDLLGSSEAARQVEERVSANFGIGRTMNSVGQVYPRSLDLAVVASLVGMASAPANLALMVRLMAGHDLATEGFKEGQVGSSAMPHKMNTRSSERINGLKTILGGHLTMASALAGDQWNEGDVSCSVVRRVVLPDSFFALDGLYETTFSVLGGFGIYPAVIRSELDRYLPFLSTTALLMHAVRNGAGREVAHEVIKKYAVRVAVEARTGNGDPSDLFRLIGEDPLIPGTAEELEAVSNRALESLGRIDHQIRGFCDEVANLIADSDSPDPGTYSGRDVI